MYTPSDQFPTLRATQWATPINTNPRLALPISASDTTIIFTSAPENHDGTPLTGNFLFNIISNGYAETCFAPSASVSGTTITGAVRGVRLTGLDYTTGDSSLAVAHNQDTPVSLNVSAVLYELISNYIRGLIASGGNNLLTGDLTAADVAFVAQNDQTDKPSLYYDESAQRWRVHQGDDGPSAGLELEFPILKGTTAQLAALPELPAGGMVAYDTTLSQTVFRESGAWVANAAGGTVPDASTTVAGKVQIATTTKADDGDDAGSTGAVNVMPPSQTSRVIQDAKYTYAADTGAADAYGIALNPAITAYAAGQTFTFKASATNTTTSTLDVNGLGAKTIKKNNDQDLAAGDIEANQVVIVTYDGTNFQMQSQSGNITASQAYVTDNTNITHGSGYQNFSADGQTITVAHGLGRVPRMITLTFFVGSGVYSYVQWGTSTYNGTTQHTAQVYSLTGGSLKATVPFSGDIYVRTNGSAKFTLTWTSLDATNFVLTSSVFFAGESVYFHWKAE